MIQAEQVCQEGQRFWVVKEKGPWALEHRGQASGEGVRCRVPGERYRVQGKGRLQSERCGVQV